MSDLNNGVRKEETTNLTSHSFNMLTENIDTDQIIPAQFLTTTTREGLGKVAFYNLRYDDSGKELDDHPLKQFNASQTSILVAGNNFGCGSSREHAPWALLDMGIRAIISTQIADIFRSNSIKNALLPIVVDEKTHAFLAAHPNSKIEIDIANTTCDIEAYGQIEFPLDDFSRYCLSHNYDQLDYLLAQSDKIKAYEDRIQN